MSKQPTPLLLPIICAVLAVSSGYASTIQEPARHRTAVFYGGSGSLIPSTNDNWLGGTGNWSNAADWSAGLPGGSSDVAINTGSDNVTLDTSSSINSLVLGGTTGSSKLTGDGNAHTVTIAGALTVNQSGNLYLSADTRTAGATSTNLGTLDLENASSLQVNGDLKNSGNLYEGLNSPHYSGVNATITGTLTNSTLGNVDLEYGSSLQVSGDFNNSGNLYEGLIEGSSGNVLTIAGDLTDILYQVEC